MEKSNPIAVAVGIITRKNGDFLVTQRQSHQHLGGYWEFPGGKVEPQESIFQTLQRELQEEVGIVVQQAEPFMEFTHAYPNKTVCLHTWWVRAFSGEPVAKEQQPLRWVALKDLESLSFPEANKAIIERVREQFPPLKSSF